MAINNAGLAVVGVLHQQSLAHWQSPQLFSSPKGEDGHSVLLAAV